MIVSNEGALTSKHGERLLERRKGKSAKGEIGTLVSQIFFFLYRQQHNALQKLNAVTMWTGGSKKSVSTYTTHAYILISS